MAGTNRIEVEAASFRTPGLAAPFPPPFFGFVDSKGHSRFVLQISIFAVSSVTQPTPMGQKRGLAAVGDTIRTRSTLSQNDPAMETHETHYFAKAQSCRVPYRAGSRTPRNTSQLDVQRPFPRPVAVGSVADTGRMPVPPVAAGFSASVAVGGMKPAYRAGYSGARHVVILRALPIYNI